MNLVSPNPTPAPAILYCHCRYAQVVPPEVKSEVLERLCASGLPFEAVPDLCELSARRVGALPNPVVPAYTAVDARLGWRMTPTVELSLTGNNLVDPRHPEWGAAPGRAEMERSWFLKLLWRM